MDAWLRDNFGGFDNAAVLPRPLPGAASQPGLPAAGSHGGKDRWVDRFAPTSVDTLAVHPKKVAEVESWLQHHFQASTISRAHLPRILVLTGPSGCGKTATVRVLAQKLGAEVSEWISPVVQQEYDEDGREVYGDSMERTFLAFLRQARNYSGLSFVGASTLAHRIILIEDLPYCLMGDAGKVLSILSDFAVSTRFPMVIVVSDPPLHRNSDSNARQNALKSQFPAAVMASHIVSKISMNAVASTIVVKALRRVVDAAGLAAEQQLLQAVSVSSSGDIRSAINTLQFVLEGRDAAKPAAAVTAATATVPRKRKKPGEAATAKATAAAEKAAKSSDSHVLLAALGDVVSGETPSFFRALGRILNAKREELPMAAIECALPARWQAEARLPFSKASDPGQLVVDSGVSAEAFAAYMHENYLAYFDSIEHAEVAIDHLSSADLFFGVWEHREKLGNIGGEVAARGLIHANVSPLVGGWKPIYKPQLYQVRRKQMELTQELRRLLETGQLPMAQVCGETVLTEVLPWVLRLARLHGHAHAVLSQLSSFQPQGFRGRVNHEPDEGAPEVDDDEAGGSSVVGAAPAATASMQVRAAAAAAAPVRRAMADDVEEFDD